MKIRYTEKEQHEYYHVTNSRYRCFWCKRTNKEIVEETKEEMKQDLEYDEDEEEEIENELTKFHKILMEHVIYWYHHNILFNHLEYRSCHYCLNKHYKIIDRKVHDNDIKRQIISRSQKKKKYDIFSNEKFRTLMRSNGMRILHNKYTKRLNLTLFYKLDIEYFDIPEGACKTFFKLSKSQIYDQFTYIYNNFYTFITIHQQQTGTTLDHIELYDDKLDKTVKLYDNKPFLFRSLLIFIFNLANPHRKRNQYTLGCSIDTMYRYYWCGILFQFYFYDYNNVYWSEHQISEHVLPEMEFVYVYVYYIIFIT